MKTWLDRLASADEDDVYGLIEEMRAAFASTSQKRHVPQLIVLLGHALEEAKTCHNLPPDDLGQITLPNAVSHAIARITGDTITLSLACLFARDMVPLSK